MKSLVLDIETDMKQTVIFCVVTKDLTTNEVICHTHPNTLKPLIEDYDTVIGHNLISFDGYHLRRLWNITIPLKKASDTLVLSRLWNPSIEGGHSLEAWGKRLGNHKIEFQDFTALTQEMIDYCIQDVNLTGELHRKLCGELKDFSPQSIDIEHKVQYIVAQQERHGFKLDIPLCTEFISQLTTKLSTIEENLQTIFPPIITERVSEKTGKKLKDHVEVFNPGSRDQIGRRLISLGWKPEKFTETGKPMVDEVILSKLSYPEAKAMAEYLLIQKRIAQSTSWLEHVADDGRVHGKVITNGAVTGRMTHHSPNMAQVPAVNAEYGETCRQVWTVDTGNVLVGCDASGLELRMLAHYMKDDEYTKEVINGDVHTKNQLAAGLESRAQAKTFIYAFLYGAGPAKIGSIVQGSAEEGKRLISSFLKNTPALKTLKDKVSKYAEKGYLPALDGRRLWVRSEHAALNTLLQGAGAISMKQGLIHLHESLKKHKIPAHFVANVHDEWQIECPKQYADDVGKLAVAAIEKAGVTLGLRCPLTGEYKVGNNWKETH
jgi:DNA polymerase I-like protein with 3'-5' exonuclease and polymerase domains